MREEREGDVRGRVACEGGGGREGTEGDVRGREGT